MKDSSKTDDVPDILGSDDAATPRQALVISVGFFIWTVVISLMHVLFGQHVDLAAMIFAELAALPIVALLFRDIRVGFGDWTFSLTPLRTLLRAFQRLKPLEQKVSAALEGSIEQGDTEIDRANPDVDGSALDETTLYNTSDAAILVRLRHEIERRLRRVATNVGIPASRINSPLMLLEHLAKANVVGRLEYQALRTLLQAPFRSPHGALTPTVAEFAREEGDKLLQTLDGLARLPEISIRREIVAKASESGIAITLDSPLGGGHRDILLDGSLLLETAAPPQTADEMPLVRETALRILAARPKYRLLIVFAARPLVPDLEHETESFDALGVGVAWKRASEFVGTKRAQALAPWLISTVFDPAQDDVQQLTHFAFLEIPYKPPPEEMNERVKTEFAKVDPNFMTARNPERPDLPIGVGFGLVSQPTKAHYDYMIANAGPRLAEFHAAMKRALGKYAGSAVNLG